MAVQSKYQELVESAKLKGVANLQVREQDNVLYIDGEAPSGAVKDELWGIYQKLDPDFRSADLVMNIDVSTMVPGARVKVSTERSNLNIRKGPGTDQPLVGKAAHGEIITLVSKTNDQWWLVRTDAGQEGYAYAQYLTPQD